MIHVGFHYVATELFILSVDDFHVGPFTWVVSVQQNKVMSGCIKNDSSNSFRVIFSGNTCQVVELMNHL